MKISFHTIYSLKQNYIGGTERFLIQICKELKALGFESQIICSSLNPEYYIENIKIIGRVPKEFQKDFVFYNDITTLFKEVVFNNNDYAKGLKILCDYVWNQVKDIETDVLHYNSFASIANFSNLSKSIVTNHENELEYNNKFGRKFFEKMIETLNANKHLKNKSILLSCPSNYYSNKFEILTKLKVLPIKLGVHLEDFKYDEKDISYKNTLFNGKDGIIILLPSRFNIEQKGHDIALKACSILKKMKVRFQLIITGIKEKDINKLVGFKKLIGQFELGPNIKLKTFNNINDAYKIADIVISPERYCSYGLSVTESLSLGIPTVMSNIPTYIEIGKNVDHAFFFESGSAEELANKLNNLSKSGYDRNRYSAIKFRIGNDIRETAKKYAMYYLNQE